MIESTNPINAIETIDKLGDPEKIKKELEKRRRREMSKNGANNRHIQSKD